LLVVVYVAAVEVQNTRDVLIRSSVPKVIGCIGCTWCMSATQILSYISAKTTL